MAASFTTYLPDSVYALLRQEMTKTGETRNAVIRRALESALSNGVTPPEVVTPDLAVSGAARIRAPQFANETYAEESVASPCCGADIEVNEGRRFCSDCGTLVPS